MSAGTTDAAPAVTAPITSSEARSYNASVESGMKPIDINGRVFLKDLASARRIASESGTNIFGFYRVRKGGVLLLDKNRVLFAFLVNNRYGERFFVSAHRIPDGRIRFMYALTEEAERLLGIDKLSYSEEQALAHRSIEQLEAAKDRSG